MGVRSCPYRTVEPCEVTLGALRSPQRGRKLGRKFRVGLTRRAPRAPATRALAGAPALNSASPSVGASSSARRIDSRSVTVSATTLVPRASPRSSLSATSGNSAWRRNSASVCVSSSVTGMPGEHRHDAERNSRANRGLRTKECDSRSPFWDTQAGIDARITGLIVRRARAAVVADTRRMNKAAAT